MVLGERIGEGRTAEVYRWEEGRVIKLYKPFMKEWAVKEWETARLVADTGLPVPGVFGLEKVEGRAGVIYERVEGLPLTRRLFEEAEAAEVVGRQLAGLHARIHACEGKGLRPFKEVLRERISHAPGLASLTRGELFRRLDGLPEGAEQLCHGDFHPDNVLLASPEPVVIDWMTAVRGLPEADAARTWLLLEHGGMPPGLPAALQEQLTQVRSRLSRSYVDEYGMLTGRRQADLEAWLPVVAAARLVELGEDEGRGLLRLIDAWLQQG
ncbi:aminoglycoside phosphotransferase [Paenibacillus mucilaginosus]|uniref:Aminoglycoside phosphotransferase n=2 Tax=Paenibacillus mucilaginosus TaxID=61624 RepID=F8FIL0_PAEMK|nr:aminoglycoside phosphotransferase [Paenibacillus mucilaginosus KNP414]WDM31440.1 phosphotransferase [Paenibacillus mucilaginosus]WFA22780.1 aminoglycoside phosphotransferase [Paenibacillus mucilaginosus]